MAREPFLEIVKISWKHFVISIITPKELLYFYLGNHQLKKRYLTFFKFSNLRLFNYKSVLHSV